MFTYITITILTFVLMEAVTWATHKYIMHGFLWYLHEDHHNPPEHSLQKNDFFFLIFAIPSWLCIMLGSIYQNYISVAIGSGIALYGFAYVVVHEIIIHQRIKWFSRWQHPYIQAIRRAHKMHHKHLGKHEGEAFGMLFVPRKYLRQYFSPGKSKS